MVAKGSHDRRSSSSTSPSTKRRTSSTTHEKKKIIKPMGICSFCLGDENKNAQGVPEDMIDCAECGNCGHPSCLRYSDRLVEKIKTVRWQCLDCKKCIICNIGDDSLLFCDFCDAAIHPKCCDPPIQHIPKGDFACPTCRDDGTMKSTRKKSVTKTSSTRSLRSKTSTDDEVSPTVISRPVAQLIDGMSNFFLPKKDKINNSQRQQSVQKAMKYLRNKTSKSKSPTGKNQLLARSILASSKTERVRKKPVISTDESPSTSQAITPTVARRSTHKKESSQQVKKRKHSTSPIPPTPMIEKKRSKNESSMKKSHSKRKESKTEVEEESETEEERKKSPVNKRKLNLDLSKYKTPPSFLNGSLPDTIAANDVYLFLDARKNSAKLISDCSDKFINSTEPIEQDANNPRWPPYIVFGSELIKTWYSSSYPQEYARVPRLFICEFCLKYMKCEQVYDRHREKCSIFHPPANEIYHKDDLSVFEVDGNIDRIYCQNLCLLAKLFLDHKTLYYDVEPFLFYVLTKNDVNGCHFLGYFSKEKHCPQKYNLSCITVLPHCQRRGYGRFLIELSYLLSQKEEQIGTPERPLSLHGAQTYEAYWKIKLVEPLLRYYRARKEKCLLKDLINATDMAIEDIVDTLQNLGVLTIKTNEKPVIHVDVTQLETIIKNEKIKHAHWVSLDSEFLRFTPVHKPIILITDGSAVDNQMKEIQVVFKKIESELIFKSTGNAAESGDGAKAGNTTEVVRLVRRRKFGRKRRSYYVKYRVSNKAESNASHHEDDQSQEYITRRRDSNADESSKDDEEEEEEEEMKTPPLPPSPLVSPSKEPKYRQLTLDQFLKKVPPKPTVPEKVFEISPKNNTTEETTSEVKNEEVRSPRRTKRLSNTHVSKSETDLTKMANGTSEELIKKPTLQKQNSLTRQVSDGTISSSNDGSPAPINSPLPFKKRAWTSSNLQVLVEPTTNPKTTEQTTLSRESSMTTPSSLSDILANPLLASSSSINSTDDETKIARIESQLKTTVEAIREVDATDDQPPSLTSPTTMLVSQSNHYNYPTRSSVAKQHQQQQQSMPMNNFDNSTNMNYNYGPTPYSYPYPSTDISPYYYSSTMPMNYMPYYPTSTSPMYPTGPPMFYQPNGANSNPYTGNSAGPYGYTTPQSSSNRRH